MTYEEIITKYDPLIKNIAYNYKLKMDYEDKIQEAYLTLYKNYDKIKDKSDGEQINFIKSCLDYLYSDLYFKEHKQLLYVTDSISKKSKNEEDFDLLDILKVDDINNNNIVRDEYLKKKLKKQREYQRNYYQNNKEKCRQKARERYAAGYKEQRIIQAKERRHRRRELFFDLSKEEQEKILEIYGTMSDFLISVKDDNYKNKRKEYKREYNKKYNKEHIEQLKKYRQTEEYKKKKQEYNKKYREKKKQQKLEEKLENQKNKLI